MILAVQTFLEGPHVDPQGLDLAEQDDIVAFAFDVVAPDRSLPKGGKRKGIGCILRLTFLSGLGRLL
jgi:hypothetical protein